MDKIDENILDKLSVPPVSQIRFPLKLWKLLNTCSSGAISWSIDGNSVIINRRIFQTEFLGRKSKTFKTQNINSLVRQLNLYGFQKVQRRTFEGISRQNWPDLLEYRHTYFRRGFPELINLVQRRSNQEDEDRIASNNLSKYHTPEPDSHIPPVQNQDDICSISPKEGNGEILEPFGIQEPFSRTQGHTHGLSTVQLTKLPLNRLNNAHAHPKIIPQSVSLSNQARMFQFPVIVPENSLQPVTLPFKTHDFSAMNVEKQDIVFQPIPIACGNLYSQESILGPMTLPVDAHATQTFQTVQSQGHASQLLQTDKLQKHANPTPQTAQSQGHANQVLQTDILQALGIQTLQTNYTNGQETDHHSQGQPAQVLQMDQLPEPDVQILQIKEIPVIKVETSEPENHLQEQSVQALEMEQMQEQMTTYPSDTIESPITLTERDPTCSVPSQFSTIDANDILTSFFIPKHADPSSP